MTGNETLTTEKNSSAFESLVDERELAEYAKDKVSYAGIFVDPGELYSVFPPSLEKPIDAPHITTAYHPSAQEVFLDALGSKTKINIIGYGNDGQNEGVLVKVEAEDPSIQNILDSRVAPDPSGELKPVLTHITLSIAEGAEAVNTRNLEFTELEEPISIDGAYKLYKKGGQLIDNKNTIIEMKNAER